MPYYRRRYGYRRRGVSRRKSTLSSRNIYANKSARSQSYQIATLRNRLTRMGRQLRPETKVWVSDVLEESYTSALSGTWLGKYEVMSPLVTTTGPSEGEMIGDKITIKSLQVLGHFDFHSVNDPQSQMLDSYGGMVRIIIVQAKSRTNDSVSSIGGSSIVTDAAGSGPGYEMMSVSPLVTGITERFKVLCDRSFSITNDKNQKMIRWSLKPNNIRKDSNQYYNKVFAFIFVSGLHWTSMTYYEEIRQALRFKVAYTDA